MASENGWQPAWVGPESLQWTKVPGTNVSLQIQKGWPLAIPGVRRRLQRLRRIVAGCRLSLLHTDEPGVDE